VNVILILIVVPEYFNFATSGESKKGKEYEQNYISPFQLASSINTAEFLGGFSTIFFFTG
jgi:hypothetical protein